jgi:hypothetical protein
MSTISNSAREELTILKERIEISNANSAHNFEVILSHNPLEEAISFAVRKYDIEIVVMGTKGVTGSKKIFFGSNTVNIIGKMRLCSLLIIPEEYEFEPPKQIAFATDFSRLYIDKEIAPLIQMADLYNSKISIVHICVNEKLNSNQEHNMDRLKSYMAGQNYSIHMLSNTEKKSSEISAFIDDFKMNILAMVNYKHSLIENLIKEPVLKDIGYHPLVPFLIIQE